MLENNLGLYIHIGLPVLNIVKVKEWYRDILGFKIIHEPSIKVEGTTIHISFLKKGELELEYYELTAEERNDYHKRKNGYIDHLAMKVKNLDKATELLIKNGAIKLDRANWADVEKLKSQMFRGIYGEKLLIVESQDPSVENFDLAFIGIAYSNKEKTINFYGQFRFEFLKDLMDSQTFFMKFNNIVLKFFFVTDEDLKKRSDGYIDHIAFDIKDVDSAHRVIEAAGVPVIEDEPVELPFWEKGIKYFNFRGPGGEKLELEQRLK